MAFRGGPLGYPDFYFRILGVRISNLRPQTTKKAARFTLRFPVISLLHQPVLFSFPQSDKWMLPSKAEEKEKIDMHSPLCIHPPNATNLAFRLFAPLIRKPLRNLCQVSVHSFSLMKQQISFTNNSCPIYPGTLGPGSTAAISGKCRTPSGPVPPRTARPRGTRVNISTLSPGTWGDKRNPRFSRRHNDEFPALDTGSWDAMLQKLAFVESTCLS